MSPTSKIQRIQRILFPLVLLLITQTLYCQGNLSGDTIISFSVSRIDRLPSNFSILSSQFKTGLAPSRISFNDENSLFSGSLGSKASKYMLTRKLYDLLVIPGQSPETKQVSRSSLSAFSAYSGKTIRNISFRKLEVFGTNINNPLAYNPGKAEAFLNKTHLNTNEIIIRKNLLFSEGDTVSPLTLSDNERLLRQLPFIDDSRIIIVPVDDKNVDILVLTKDVYSLGANYEYSSLHRGSIDIYDKNLLGLGHEFRLNIPYDRNKTDSPGFGIEYKLNNLGKSFVNMSLYFFDGLGSKSYGVSLDRKLVSSATKYAGGISIKEMFTTVDLDTLSVAAPLKYNLQDYWLSRSFLINRESVSRIILGVRYTNNNVFDRPFILPDSYHYLQKYKMFLGSLTYSIQKYYNTSLMYGYGRTEDIPYGGMITITGGREINEFRNRYYAGLYAATGNSIRPLGYFYTSAGLSTFMSGDSTSQGMLTLRSTFFTNLLYIHRFRLRNFLMVDYTRGFDRNTDEYLVYNSDNGFSGFRNDSVGGTQRLSLGVESVLFSPANIYGFKFAFFAFADISLLFGTNEFLRQGEALSSIGLGIRIRNDNLVFNTFQIRLALFPNLPPYSRVNYLLISGEQLLKHDNFDPGPPTIIPFR